MPKAIALEELFKQNRKSSIYLELWQNSHNKRDPLITKWIEHIEKSTEKTRPYHASEKE
jgi:hypothetical protein